MEEAVLAAASDAAANKGGGVVVANTEDTRRRRAAEGRADDEAAVDRRTLIKGAFTSVAVAGVFAPAVKTYAFAGSQLSPAIGARARTTTGSTPEYCVYDVIQAFTGPGLGPCEWPNALQHIKKDDVVCIECEGAIPPCPTSPGGLNWAFYYNGDDPETQKARCIATLKLRDPGLCTVCPPGANKAEKF